MATALRAYIDKHCVRHATAHYPLKAFVAAFRANLPVRARPDWTRGRIYKELLRESFLVANLNGVSHVAGIAPRAGWVEVDGKLELSRDAT